MIYEQLFERNYGIFEAEEQARIRDARAAIVGCGGIGAVTAVALARSGLGHFSLYEFDTYSPSNMNRQITCFTDTLGMNKAMAVRDSILSINSEAEIDICMHAVTPEEIDEVILDGDVFLPAADNWALSITMLDRAKQLGKPAIMAYPVGALGRVSTFLPESPYAAECVAIPPHLSYVEMKAFMEDPNNRRILQYYQTVGGWRQEWFDQWCESKQPHPQICTIVWITGVLAAMEILKLVSGKWQPVVAPRYWHVTPSGARMATFSPARRWLARQHWGASLVPFLAKRPWLVRLFTRAIS
jgi:molybdopterin/thiamine biosynthesis adenylyltransferase